MQAHARTEGDINLSAARRQWDARHTHAATQALLEDDARYFLHQSLSTPCLDALAFCEGIYVTNLEGRRYMDFHGNNVHQLGYKNAYVLDRVKEQLDTLHFCPRRYTNQPAVELARQLATLTGHQLTRTLFAPGGDAAIGMALKLARVITGKYKTISMWDAFHGASIDSLSVGGERLFRDPLGPLLPGAIHVPPPDSYRGMWFNPHQPEGDLAYTDYLEYVIEKEGGIGAVVAETVRNTVVQFPSRGYWQRVREICNKHGVLLILDEIPVCLGRTGEMFAWQLYGIQPDILVIGKGLGAGVMPMAAMLCRDEYNRAAHTALGHYTHEKSPLGAAAALAAIHYIQEHQLLQHVQATGRYMEERLLRMQSQFPCIGQVRGKGMLWGVELVRDRSTREKAVALAEQVMYRCLENGLSFKVSDGSVLSLYPPLVTTQEQMATAMDILEEALNHLKQYSC